MAVGLDHPDVARFLARLEEAAAVLPPARREELVGDISEHLREALADAGATGSEAGDAAVRSVLDRLGDPADIVAAETDGAPSAGGGADGAPRLAGPAPLQFVVRPGSAWSGLEYAAVGFLVVGTFLLPVLGPVIGIVLAWVSTRWTRREKVVATVWASLPLLVAVLAALALLVAVPTSTRIDNPVPAVTSVVTAP